MSIKLILDESLFDKEEDTVEMEVTGGTIGECLEYAFARQPELRSVIFQEDGQLRRNINIRVNIKYQYPDNLPEVLTKPVEEGDEIGVSFYEGGG